MGKYTDLGEKRTKKKKAARHEHLCDKQNKKKKR